MNINSEKNILFGRLIAFVMAALLLFVFDMVRAGFSEPLSTPPATSIRIPVSASSTVQVKTGALSVLNLTAGSVLVGGITPAPAGRVFVGGQPFDGLPDNSIAVSEKVRGKRFCLGAVTASSDGCLGVWSDALGSRNGRENFIVKGSFSGLSSALISDDNANAGIGTGGSARNVYSSALEVAGTLNAAVVRASTTIPSTNMILTVDTVNGNIVLKKCGTAAPFLRW